MTWSVPWLLRYIEQATKVFYVPSLQHYWWSRWNAEQQSRYNRLKAFRHVLPIQSVPVVIE